MPSRIILFVFYIIVNTICYGQHKRSMHWYFGWKAGLDFTSGIPVADTNSNLISIEGSATISDTAGNLLFYSSGEYVWNRQHKVMPNGNMIMGDQSAVQSSLITPMPGSDSLYYLFTATSWNWFRYNIIDMSLDSGRGDVLVRDVLISKSTEAMAGTRHCNYRDYWIMIREPAEGALVFKAYRVSPDGLHGPFTSSFALPNHIDNVIGCHTFSQDGTRLVFSSFATDIYLFDFNKRTGLLTLANTINIQPGRMVYHTALSPDNTKLYVSCWDANCNIIQYDLSAANINNTATLLDTVNFRNGSPNAFGFIGQLHIGPDQKIYISRWNQEHPYMVDPETFYSLDSLDVINNPNATGLACNFQRNAVYLQKKTTQIGLPNFISNFTNPEVDRSDSCDDFTLPVILSGISVVMQQDKPVIKWETQGEMNADHFTVEKSTDAIHFNIIGTVRATGTSSTVNKYSFTDARPPGGICYYRLVMVDIDGKMQISNIVKLVSESNSKMHVFPNPFSDNICIQSPATAAMAHVELRDAEGKLIFNRHIVTSSTGTINISVSNIARGVYFLKIFLNGAASTFKLSR